MGATTLRQLLFQGCILTALALDSFMYVHEEEAVSCAKTNKPCRIFVQSLYNNGTIMQLYNTMEQCSCGPGVTCPSSWEEDPERTASKYLSQQDRSLAIQFKYCQVKETPRICKGREIALSLRGMSLMPQEVTSLNCNCANNRPLYLRSTKIVAFYRNEEYVCSMPKCSAGKRRRRTCLRKNKADGKTTILCRCPAGQKCRKAPSPPGSNFVRGACS